MHVGNMMLHLFKRKKMKKYIRLVLCSLGCAMLSCDPSLVDQEPFSPTEQSYFSSANEFRAQLVGIYAGIYDDYNFSGVGYNGWVSGAWLLPGDDLTESRGGNTYFELFDGSLNPNNSRVEFIFRSAYKQIAKTNVMIDRVKTVDFSTFDGADEIAGMEGEALFFRAYAYFKLFNVFGSVPLVTKRLQTQEEANTPKSPALDVLSQVITDLKAALAIVPENRPAAAAGRITKNSVRGLLTKALVFRGGYTGSTADHQEALTYFNAITAVLVPDYLHNFSAATENNAESLYELQATTPSSGNNNLNLAHDGAWRGVENMSVFRGFMMEVAGRGDFNDATNTRYLVTEKLLSAFGSDPRISVFLNPEDGVEGRIFQKYNKPDGANQLSGFHGGSVNNERILRYADVKLLAAEAALKTGNPGAAIGHVNDIRDRARSWAQASGYGDGTVPEAHPTTETNVGTIMGWIRDERFVELAGEGHRWWDLKRWHAAGDINLSGWTGDNNGFSTYLASPVQFDVSKHLVFPLPHAEIERNSSITENNPGYD